MIGFWQACARGQDRLPAAPAASDYLVDLVVEFVGRDGIVDHPHVGELARRVLRESIWYSL